MSHVSNETWNTAKIDVWNPGELKKQIMWKRYSKKNMF